MLTPSHLSVHDVQLPPASHSALEDCNVVDDRVSLTTPCSVLAKAWYCGGASRYSCGQQIIMHGFNYTGGVYPRPAGQVRHEAYTFHEAIEGDSERRFYFEQERRAPTSQKQAQNWLQLIVEGKIAMACASLC